MDPNEALKKIRELNKQLLEDDLTRDDAGIVGEELAELVNELDEWLSKGGFPPKDWTKPRPVVV